MVGCIDQAEIRLGSIYTIQFDNLKPIYGYVHTEEDDGVYGVCAVSPTSSSHNEDDVVFGDITVHPWAVFPVLDIMFITKQCELPMECVERIYNKLNNLDDEIPMDTPLFRYRENILNRTFQYATRSIGFVMDVSDPNSALARCH